MLLASLLWATATPLLAQTAAYRFVTWADSKDHTCVLYGLSRLASAKNPAFTIFPGDLTPDTDIATDTQNLNRCPGNASQNVTWKTAINGGDPGSGLWDRTFASKGNHDDIVGDWLTYFDFAAAASRIGATRYSEFLSADICGANPCRAYSFDYRNSHFVGADVMSGGNVGDLPADIVTWMDGDLTAAEGRAGIDHAFLFWHGPLYGVDGHTSVPSSKLISLLNKHAIVAATFHGHEHVHAHVHVDSAHVPGISRAFEQFVSGGAGADQYPCNASKIQAGDWCVGQASDPPPYGPGFKGYATVDVQATDITVRYYDALDVQRASFSFTHSQPAVTGIAPESGWWWDPNLSGAGFFLEYGGKSGNGIFAGGFWYDAAGNNTWRVSTGQYTPPTSTYANMWLKTTGGQTLLGPYKQPTTAAAGNLGMTFSDASHAVLTRPDGTTINLQRFSFTASPTPAAPLAGAPQSGWWWAGSSFSGTGYGIEIQGNGVFIVAYVYDGAGNPVWYLTNGTLTSPSSYSGVWDAYAGGPQFTSPEGTYHADKVPGLSVPMALVFSDATHGTLTMGSVTVPIVRFQGF